MTNQTVAILLAFLLASVHCQPWIHFLGAASSHKNQLMNNDDVKTLEKTDSASRDNRGTAEEYNYQKGSVASASEEDLNETVGLSEDTMSATHVDSNELTNTNQLSEDTQENSEVTSQETEDQKVTHEDSHDSTDTFKLSEDTRENSQVLPERYKGQEDSLTATHEDSHDLLDTFKLLEDTKKNSEDTPEGYEYQEVTLTESHVNSQDSSDISNLSEETQEISAVTPYKYEDPGDIPEVSEDIKDDLTSSEDILDPTSDLQEDLESRSHALGLFLRQLGPLIFQAFFSSVTTVIFNWFYPFKVVPPPPGLVGVSQLWGGLPHPKHWHHHWGHLHQGPGKWGNGNWGQAYWGPAYSGHTPHAPPAHGHWEPHPHAHL